MLLVENEIVNAGLDGRGMALGAVGRRELGGGFELLPLADGFERADDPDEVGDRARQAVKPRGVGR